MAFLSGVVAYFGADFMVLLVCPAVFFFSFSSHMAEGHECLATDRVPSSTEGQWSSGWDSGRPRIATGLALPRHHYREPEGICWDTTP